MPRTVLVIDDDVAIRELYLALLPVAEPGVTILTAGTAGLGIAIAAARRPNLIYVDQRLPDQRGTEAVPVLRASCPEARIVLVSGSVDGVLEELAAAAGADSCRDKVELLGSLRRIPGGGSADEARAH